MDRSRMRYTTMVVLKNRFEVVRSNARFTAHGFLFTHYGTWARVYVAFIMLECVKWYDIVRATDIAPWNCMAWNSEGLFIKCGIWTH